VSKFFLGILKEVVPDLSPEVERILLKRQDQLTKNDLPILRKDISPNINKWIYLMKKKYTREGRPKEWAEQLREQQPHDMLDIVVLDVVGRVAVFGERPVSNLGWVSVVTRILTWAGMGATVWSFATRQPAAWTGSAVVFTGLMIVATRVLAIQDIWRRYGK
jgi:hypothetical protein